LKKELQPLRLIADFCNKICSGFNRSMQHGS
jgi:hypothetical protein